MQNGFIESFNGRLRSVCLNEHLFTSYAHTKEVIEAWPSTTIPPPHRADDVEQLIVELKAPRVKIGPDEITQAKRYAIAVSRDERFHTIKGVVPGDTRGRTVAEQDQDE